jgi:predicted RNA binding protein YcfA (HicA-like mRNA interferase family)
MRKSGSPLIVTVPMKRGDVAPGTLRDIIKDAGMTVEEFISLL